MSEKIYQVGDEITEADGLKIPSSTGIFKAETSKQLLTLDKCWGYAGYGDSVIKVVDAETKEQSKERGQ